MAPPSSRDDDSTLGDLYALVAGDEDVRVCKDIPDEACDVVPRNFTVHLAAQVTTKIGDSLSDPKLVLSWLLASLGAPSAAVAALVPVREAGALLPQLAIGGVIRGFSIRKWFWVGGSLAQAAAVIAMALLALLDPPGAAWWIVALVAVFSVGRAVCSVSSKDLVGKTVPKTRRGRLGGLASSVSGAVALLVGFGFLMRGDAPIPAELLAAVLAVAATAWVLAAGTMAALDEKPGATEGGRNALVEAARSAGLLVTDRNFRAFCITRALLASTALSMPFYVVLARRATEGRLEGFGILLFASSGAAMSSGAVWGWMADRSSRRTLAAAGTAAGLVGVVTYVTSGLSPSPALALWIYGGLFFAIGLAHTGIRLGRKTYVVDLATAETRAPYVAVSNTFIGVVLFGLGALGSLATVVGERGIVLLYALLGLVGGLAAWSLPEVQD